MLLYATFGRMDDAEESGWRNCAVASMRQKLGAAVDALEAVAASLCKGTSKASLDRLCTELREHGSGEYV